MSENMVRSCVVFETSAANFWVGMMGAFRGPRPLDSTRHAKLCLRATLDEINAAEHESQEEIARLVSKIKKMQSGAKTKRVDVDALKSMLLQCRKIRLKLSMLAKKKQALENHMETLDNSELNQHVLHSMQKTSNALKGMGLEKTLESVDRVMLDLEENHGDVSNIQSSLASSFDNVDDFDWEAEMEMLLESDTYAGDIGGYRTQTKVPVSINTISQNEVEEQQLELSVPEQLKLTVHFTDTTPSQPEEVALQIENSGSESEANVPVPLPT